MKYEYWDYPRYDAAVSALLAQRPPGPVWIFAYGSLIWKPEMQHTEHRRGVIHGWHRSFCINLTRWRGSPEQPGLMMCLDRGGRCEGVAFRLSDAHCADELKQLLLRELGSDEAFESVRWVNVRADDQVIRAVTFYAYPSRLDTYVGKWPLEKVAHNLARACGHLGSGAEYLYQTVSKLEEFGIHDGNLWKLQELVANEIIELRQS